MDFVKTLERTLTKMGKNNSPIIAVVGIAVAKGIFRPIVTMIDKKENPETKRYTAIREGLTEVIAIPVYYLSGKGAQKLASAMAKPQFFMDKELYKQHKNGVVSTEVQNAYKHAQKLAEENLPKLKTNMTFVGVCAAALFFIPAICSATIKPLMSAFNLNKKEDKKPEIVPQTLNKPICQYNNKVFKTFSNVPYSGMKVGGV